MRKKIVPFLGVRVCHFAWATVISLAASGTLSAKCMGPGAPTNTKTRCLTAVSIPGNAIRSFDISWVDSERGLYFLGDRSNSGVDIIKTGSNKDSNHWIGRAGGFVGIKNLANGMVDNNHSGPDGVVSHGNWLYAGDGDSTLKVFDISDPTKPSLVATLSTGGTTRVDEMALTTDGELLLAVNNAEDPPYATLFAAHGAATAIIGKVTVDPAIIPVGAGLSIEQPAWDERTKRFYVSVPTIANNPSPCNYVAPTPPATTPAVTCSGGLLTINPSDVNSSGLELHSADVVSLNECGPNGLTLGPSDNLLEGCTPRNEPSNRSELVINADSFNFANIGNITGADEVWFNEGDNRYYTGSSSNITSIGGPVLGVIDAITNLLIETIPQSSGSHSVAADSHRNTIYVPQVAPSTVVGSGGDTTNVGAQICGTMNGCVAVYKSTSGEEE
jgi:hypothetical protein